MTITRISKLVLPCLMLAFSLSAIGNDFTSLEERMTGEEFRAAGLDKLSESELEALNRWIRQRSLAEYEYEGREAAAQQPQEDRRGLRERAGGLFGGGDEIVTRIEGEFTGWSGPTEFRMENGMVWETVGSGTFGTPRLENPEVTISSRFGSGWEMRVEGYNRRVQVRRIE